MNQLVASFNLLASLALFGLCTWAVMSDRVRDGVILKAGLILMALALLSTALILSDGLDPSDVWRLNHSRAVLLLGGLIAAFGLVWRLRNGQRRSTDFIERRTSQ